MQPVFLFTVHNVKLMDLVMGYYVKVICRAATNSFSLMIEIQALLHYYNLLKYIIMVSYEQMFEILSSPLLTFTSCQISNWLV